MLRFGGSPFRLLTRNVQKTTLDNRASIIWQYEIVVSVSYIVALSRHNRILRYAHAAGIASLSH